MPAHQPQYMRNFHGGVLGSLYSSGWAWLLKGGGIQSFRQYCKLGQFNNSIKARLNNINERMPKVKALNKVDNQQGKEGRVKDNAKGEEKKAGVWQGRASSLTRIIGEKQNMRSRQRDQQQPQKLKKVFYKLSLIQLQYNLRFSTLFHALEIYRISSKALLARKQEIPEGYLILACLYLSAKYQEIYPPKLKHFASYFKTAFLSIKLYRNYEKKVLDILQGNLNLRTVKAIIESKLEGCERSKYFMAYYHIEHCFFNDEISSTFSYEEICEAVQMLIKPVKVGKKVIKKQVQQCAKMILLCKSQQSISSDFLFRKYSKQAYMNVSREQIHWEQR